SGSSRRLEVGGSTHGVYHETAVVVLLGRRWRFWGAAITLAVMSGKPVKVGLVQMAMSEDRSQNLAKALEGVRAAAGRGARIVCLPELFGSLYFCQVEDAALFDLAESVPGP